VFLPKRGRRPTVAVSECSVNRKGTLMSFEYPSEIKEQQAKVKREIEKLARMRTEHLMATGQMPSATSGNQPVRNRGTDSVASPKAQQQAQVKSA